ncbi:hypothetical protein GCM10025881_36320 [Pseudolysinimonas kribbensis]|uniref:Uncharacterized protein n=1 Tax=Pseudolysinimonas kribbensis TaxID=433641 RepID=A0ABQ6K838_9MICO|nr:hypothetical protein GCM10025881_36320 [Pseudolysinimonas kribbensis]
MRVARSDRAWALPRPSAIDSARLANRTVIHSQTAIAALKVGGRGRALDTGACRNGSAIA